MTTNRLRQLPLIVLALFALAFLPGCASSPRVTTPAEREVATQTLAMAETALGALLVAGKIPSADYHLAMDQAVELQKQIDASATTPVSWSSIYLRVLNFALQWGVQKSSEQDPPKATGQVLAPIPGNEWIPPGEAPPPPAKINAAPMLEALQARADALPKRFTLLTAPTPSGPETLVSSQLRITITGHLGWQLCPDETFIVWVGENTQVLDVQSTDGDVGFAFNVPGPNNTDIIGSKPTLPRQVTACDALYCCSGPGGNVSPRAQLGYATGVTPKVDEACAVVFVPYDCRKDTAGPMLRPPVWGARGALVDFLRAFPFPIDAIDWNRLPSVFLDSPKPALSLCYGEHRYFGGDVFSEWSPHWRGVPTTAHQQYGTFVSGQAGQALLLCVDEALTLADRKPLVLALMQRGIDDLGGLCDQSWRYALGGHCWGRVGTLVLLGHMYAIDVFADPTPVVGNRLPEHQLVTVTSWWGQPNWTGYLYSTSNNGASNPALWSTHPSTWGDPANHADAAWQVVYGEQAIPALTATAAFIRILGREASAPKLVNAVRCWMSGPPAAEVAALWAAGINLNIGPGPFPDNTIGPIDYAMTPGFGRQAWARYGN